MGHTHDGSFHFAVRERSNPTIPAVKHGAKVRTDNLAM
jgi:hypothetical protein